eukprot:TRINITY_DN7827_c3_g1_i2.p1 TRINITY_DN7827_c3_g1~~TRINITY_DN7827_c3_g1_i2.p1  ORF type:complete len:555 (+),score=185.85 TRINITY_DN7827_c3_g1_i2:100-1665(+)
MSGFPSQYHRGAASNAKPFSFKADTRTANQLLNQQIVQAEYAVRGMILLESEKIQQEMQQDPKKYPFTSLVACNIGNPQALLQKPITYNRQVMALVDCPTLIDTAHLAGVPRDVVQRARNIVKMIGHPHKTGAYSHSKGLGFIRESIARFLERRDGVPADPEHIYLTDGASSGVKMVLSTMTKHEYCSFLIPMPQYPLYSATLAMLEAKPAPYYLNERSGWSIDLPELERAYKQSRDDGHSVRAIVVINPGNPTGQLLTVDSMIAVCRFARDHGLMVLADEVYQQNVYCVDPATGAPKQFTSFKKVIATTPDISSVPLVSFHSTSKGLIGECGRRGGYMECYNIIQPILDVFTKLASINLCSNLNGQLMTHLMVEPPTPGDESYPQWKQENAAIYASMKKRATIMAEGLNAIPGISSQPIEGAMYAFPQIQIPERAVEEAIRRGLQADSLWCLGLLRSTGIIVVPGSGFGQVEGTWHFRTTILPPEDQMVRVVEQIAEFHRKFCAEWAGPASGHGNGRAKL